MPLFHRWAAVILAAGLGPLSAGPAAAATDFTMIVGDGVNQGAGSVQKFAEDGSSEGSFADAVHYYGSIPRWGPGNNIYTASWRWNKSPSGGGSTNLVRLARYTASGALVGADASNVFFETDTVADSFQDAAFDDGTRLYVADIGDRQSSPANAGDRAIRVFETANIGGALGNADVELPSLTLPTNWNPYGLGFNPTNQDQLYVQARDANEKGQVFRFNRVAGVWSLDAGYALSGYDNDASGVDRGFGLDLTFDAAGNMYLLMSAAPVAGQRVVKLTPGQYDTLTGGDLDPDNNGNDEFAILKGPQLGGNTGLAWFDGRIYLASYASSAQANIIYSYKDDGTNFQAFGPPVPPGVTLDYSVHLDILDNALVPEPASVTLLSLAGLSALGRPRRRADEK